MTVSTDTPRVGEGAARHRVIACLVLCRTYHPVLWGSDNISLDRTRTPSPPPTYRTILYGDLFQLSNYP
ncbi:hypothetical protein J6590_010262 [Homalodisca vitripennis]|nr:hypothetical protein J6590_010262 [Homalodisca vitripennis]